MAYVLDHNDTLTAVCPNCGCTIGYTENETYMGCGNDGTDGLVIDCPNCRDMILVEKCSPSKWPKAFFHYGEGPDAVHLSNERIQEMINDCIRAMVRDKLDYYYLATGDTMVCTFWDDENMDVYVTKNYYSAFLDEDYLNKRFGKYCVSDAKNPNITHCTTTYASTGTTTNPPIYSRTEAEQLLDIPNVNVTQEIINKANRCR